MNNRNPELPELVASLLHSAGCYEPSAAAAIGAKLLDPATEQLTVPTFRKWCQSEAAPVQIRYLERGWYELFFWCGWSLRYSNRNFQQIFVDGEDLGEVFPYLMLDSLGCRVKYHHLLDGLIGMRKDAIWEALWPPSGWLCSCTARQLMADDPEGQALIARGASQNLNGALFASLTDWPMTAPGDALKIAE